jgi:hypothetical protein
LPAYASLVDRLNRFPQGAPPSDTLLRILKMLFVRRRLGWWRCCRSAPSPPSHASRVWKLDLAETQKDARRTLAERAILLDMQTPAGHHPTCCRRRWPASSSSP